MVLVFFLLFWLFSTVFWLDLTVFLTLFWLFFLFIVLVVLVVFDNVLVGFNSVFDIVLVVHGSGCFRKCRSFFYSEISEILLRF